MGTGYAGGAHGWIRWTLLVAVLLAVALPRFDLHDPGAIRKLTAGATATRYGLPLDVEGYIRLGEYFRGETPADSLIPPYCYRLLVPFAASALPWRVQTSINVLDVLALLLTLVLLDRLLLGLGFDTRARTIGGLLFAVSFPTFYYGAIGFVDPVVLLIETAMILAVFRGRTIAFTVLLVAGVLVKETTAAMAFLPGAWAWARHRAAGPDARRVAALAAVAAATALAVRTLAPFPERGWLWLPSLGSLADNLSRPRAILSLVFTLGLPAACATIAVVGERAKRRLSPEHLRFLLAGSGLTILLYIYSLFSAYADGRVIWAAYPFLIPISVTLWGSAAVPSRHAPSGGAPPDATLSLAPR